MQPDTRAAWTRRWSGGSVSSRRVGLAFERAVERAECGLVTILGPAGVGKSRLAAEALRGDRPRATVLSGSCLAYGEGITFWPILEVVCQAVGIADDDDPAVATGKIAAALAGEDSGPSPPSVSRS